MRKIAIPVSNGILSPHFGHCDRFYICEADDNKVISESYITSPPHEPGILPQWLKSHGVTDVIAGGMGHRAISLFKQSDINVFVGAPKIEPAEIISEFLKGTLKLTDNYCDH
jgi:predicted Fe-Mo cluster-binding NifX family protein